MAATKEFEMGLDLRDIDRTMPLATRGYTLQKTTSGYDLSLGEKQVKVSLKAAAPRVIAGLSLPKTMLNLTFTHHSEEDIEKFMFRFMRHFHRGGG